MTIDSSNNGFPAPDDDVNRGLRYRGNICISGLTSAGKTTHSHLLAGEFGLTYVSGSQIQLNFLGVSPIQSKEFWITQEAKSLWDENQFRSIDSELLRLETLSKGYVFDTSTMPWRHKYPALCIWLGSTLDSRVVKAIVSHRGNTTLPHASYPERIASKDYATISLYKRLYEIEIGNDLSCFDLILDISTLITRPTLADSLHSIAKAHAMVRSAAAWYLTGHRAFKSEFLAAVRRHPEMVKRNRVARLIGDGDGESG